MSGVVYHYCSVDTFFNIIKNSSVWLSDISKSNDYQECVRCREFVNKGSNAIRQCMKDGTG